MRILKRLVCALLLVSLFASLVGCGDRIYAEDLMAGIEPASMTVSDDITEGAHAAFDFALALYKSTYRENSLMSPTSVYFALSMLQNGAADRTLSELEGVLGLTRDEANVFVYSYMKSLGDSEKCKLKIANSLWLRDIPEFSVNQNFLRTNANYHSAAVYRAPFDHTTVRDINTWVKSKTDGVIKDIVEDIPPEAITYLINTLSFSGEWEEVYEDNSVSAGYFNGDDGSRTRVDFMYSTEYKYIDTENAVGFMKYYKGGDYAFVALLPDEGVALSDYVEGLCASELYSAISTAESLPVIASVPKYELSSEYNLNEALMALGMTSAFNPETADFSAIGSSDRGNIFVGAVRQKAYISVFERGTRAGAATVVEIKDGSAGPMDERIVHLDRPFLFMIVDTESSLPLFMGTLNSL